MRVRSRIRDVINLNYDVIGVTLHHLRALYTGVGKSQSGGARQTLSLSLDIFRTVSGSEDRLKVYLDIRCLDIRYLQNCDKL